MQQNSVTIQQIDGVVSRVERSDVSSDVQHQGFIEQLKEDLRLSKTQVKFIEFMQFSFHLYCDWLLGIFYL